MVDSLRDCPRLDSPLPVIQVSRRVYHHPHPPLSREDLIREALADDFTPLSGPSDLSDIGHDPPAHSIFPEQTSSTRITTTAGAQSGPSDSRSVLLKYVSDEARC